MANDRGTIQEVGGVIRRVPAGQSPGTLRAGAATVRVENNTDQPVTGTIEVIDTTPKPDPTQMNWRPLTAPRRVTFLGTSFVAVHRALNETFGEFPIRLTAGDTRTIKAMANVAGEGRAPYDQIAEALGKHGDVEVGIE